MVSIGWYLGCLVVGRCVYLQGRPQKGAPESYESPPHRHAGSPGAHAVPGRSPALPAGAPPTALSLMVWPLRQNRLLCYCLPGAPKCPKQWTLYRLYCLYCEHGPLFWALWEVQVNHYKFLRHMMLAVAIFGILGA